MGLLSSALVNVKAPYARVAELADAGDLKSLASNGVWVRAPPRVPLVGRFEVLERVEEPVFFDRMPA